MDAAIKQLFPSWNEALGDNDMSSNEVGTLCKT